ncbi:MAG: TonB-dependent receptor plug domain-containing protein [Bacteroidota bacterium]|nr:TonB-dependent receptor plug domain-containing protein [Bacteroidota bacterium]
MKLMIFLMTAAFLQVSASGNSQTVNYSGKEVSLKKVFNVIKSQTGSVFFYDVELLRDAKPVTVDLKNVLLETALNEIFKDQQLTWVMENRTITIVKKQASVIKGIIDTEVSDPPQIDVKGRVVNEKGEPLEGVTVTVKGTRIATATNGNGEFVLSGVNKSAKLVFSGVNVETTEMSIDNRTDLNVTLKTKISEMMDVALVVNTGFQTISKERATGSFTVISKEQLEKPTTNIAQRLIGTTAGVQGKLDVDGNPTFEIRGQTSLFAQQQPLIVVDGFPVQGDFTSINPNDVETVTILKDAAAASIWGARSANGVIVITTKSAKKGTPLKVELNAFTRIGRNLI